MPEIKIDSGRCIGCGICLKACPVNVFAVQGKKAVAVKAENCMGCRLCESECPQGAIRIERFTSDRRSAVQETSIGSFPVCERAWVNPQENRPVNNEAFRMEQTARPGAGMPIFDFRCRPNTPEYISLLDGPVSEVFRKTGRQKPQVSTLEQFVADLDQAGISKILCTGRDIETTAKWKVTNDYVAGMMRQYPGKIYGFAGIDPLKGKAAVLEIERAIKELGLLGVSIDPFAAGMLANDRRIYPVYEKCDALGVPIAITIGPLPVPGNYLSWGSPMPVDEVATELPDLKIICSHGGWPFTHEMITIAFRHDNVYFENSVYNCFPGSELLVQAANKIISDKFLFATGHPFSVMKDTVEEFKQQPFAPGVREKVMWENAHKLLGLDCKTSVGNNGSGRVSTSFSDEEFSDLCNNYWSQKKSS